MQATTGESFELVAQSSRRDFISKALVAALAAAGIGIITSGAQATTIPTPVPGPVSYQIRKSGGIFYGDSMVSGSSSFSNADFPTLLQETMNAWAALPNPGNLFFKAEDYPLGTNTPVATIPKSLLSGIDQGQSWGIIGEGNSIRGKAGTRFMFGAVDQTFLKWDATAPSVPVNFTLKDFCLNKNGFTDTVGGGAYGIDLSGIESSCLGSEIDNVGFTALTPAGVQNGQFDSIMNLDGCEDLVLHQVKIDGEPNVSSYATTGIHWNVPSGNITIDFSFFYPFGTILTGSWQTLWLRGGVFDGGIKMTNSPNVLTFIEGIYSDLSSILNNFPFFDGGGFSNSNPVLILGTFIRLHNLKGLFTNALSWQSISMLGCQINTLSGQSAPFSDIATVGNRNLFQRGCRFLNITSLPWNIGTFIGGGSHAGDPAWLTTTPVIPASGTFIQNPNGYPVRIFFTNANTLTAVSIRDMNNTVGTTQTITNANITMVELGPLERIALTYVGLAPTWAWHGVE